MSYNAFMGHKTDMSRIRISPVLMPTLLPTLLLMILVFILAVPVLSSCERIRLRRDVNRIMESRIVLPQELSVALDGEVKPMDNSLRTVPKMIVYVDSTECTMCRVSKFKTYYDSIYNESRKDGRFELILLIYSRKVEGIPVSRLVSDFEFGIPVYVDEKNTFLKDNPAVPQDSRLHAFFVDGNGSPVFIGDPGMNKRIRDMLGDYLNGKLQLPTQ